MERYGRPVSGFRSFELSHTFPRPEVLARADLIHPDLVEGGLTAAAAAWIVHMEWLTDPSATPGTRNAPIDRARIKARIFARYEGRWDLLDASSSECPILLSPQLRTFAKEARVGLPPGHPWHLELPAW